MAEPRKRWSESLERFARQLAIGASAGEAALASGYKGKLASHARRARRPAVQRRVAELIEEAKAANLVTDETILADLRMIRDRALADKQHTAAARAVEIMGKVSGVLVDRVDQRNLNYNFGRADPREMTNEELDKRIAELMGEVDRLRPVEKIGDTELARRIAFMLSRAVEDGSVSEPDRGLVEYSAHRLTAEAITAAHEARGFGFHEPYLRENYIAQVTMALENGEAIPAPRQPVWLGKPAGIQPQPEPETPAEPDPPADPPTATPAPKVDRNYSKWLDNHFDRRRGRMEPDHRMFGG